jgi:hypothetical protein
MQKIFLLTNAVQDMTGGTINIFGEVGKISGDIIKKAEIDELKNNLFLN